MTSLLIGLKKKNEDCHHINVLKLHCSKLNLLCSPSLKLFDQKYSKSGIILKSTYILQFKIIHFYYYIFVKMYFFPVMAIFSIITSDPSEIILIY